MTSDSTATRGHRKPKRRGLKIIGGLAAAVLVGWFVYATVNVVSPSQGQLQARSDAVVSLAPQFHRLPLAEVLVSDGVAGTLVISFFQHDRVNIDSEVSGEPVPLATYCEPDASPGVMCFTPEENATIGEAYAIADMAEAQSWDALTIVTDPYHAFRTRFIFEQCLGDEVDVNVVFDDRDLTARQWVWHVVYENAAFLKAAWQTTVRC